MSKTDRQLKQDVEDELASDPQINAARIAVDVEGGAVSLRGVVDTLAGAWAAEEATRRVGGVCTIVRRLAVEVRPEHQHGDQEIATAVRSALRWNVLVPRTVMARVDRGAVTLSGQVTWNYQREAAERAVHVIEGVVAIVDLVALVPGTSALQHHSVLLALQRHAMTDARSIRIEAVGSRVTLSGATSSWSSLDDAVTAAWAAPGVTEVINRVTLVAAAGS